MSFAAVVLLGYLLGSCPWGYWLARLLHHEDIRRRGSGSIGASNVFRLYGRRLGFAVSTLDIAKGFVPAFVGTELVSPVCGILAGAAAMAGHWRPLFLRFEKGGKMVATAGGAFLGVAPPAAGAAIAVWLVVFALTRYTSVASILAVGSLPVWAWLLGYPWSVIAFAAGSATTVLFLHRSNMRRLWHGTENRFRLRRAAPHVPQ
jgi:glycerol-3-phosphate acyltransferase PlsY